MFVLLVEPYAMIQMSILLQPHRTGCEFRPRQFRFVSAEPRLKNTDVAYGVEKRFESMWKFLNTIISICTWNLVFFFFFTSSWLLDVKSCLAAKFRVSFKCLCVSLERSFISSTGLSIGTGFPRHSSHVPCDVTVKLKFVPNPSLVILREIAGIFWSWIPYMLTTQWVLHVEVQYHVLVMGGPSKIKVFGYFYM